MFHEIILLVVVFLSLLMEQAARQGRAVPVPDYQRNVGIRWHYLNGRHLIEETPSALSEAEAFALSTIYEDHIGVQCDVVLEVIGFLEANYNPEIYKSQEPSAIILSFIFYTCS